MLLIRECITSYTKAMLVENEQHGSIRDALICLCAQFLPIGGPRAVIRTDSAPAFIKLKGDELLKTHQISLEIGRVKNINKNPVAEKAIQELEEELVKNSDQDHSTANITPRSLSLALPALNSRIRTRGLSAIEMWLQRDQWTNEQLPVSDLNLISQQQQHRHDNHTYSKKSKAPHGRKNTDCSIKTGDIVYLYCDRDKTQARKQYLIVSVEGQWCQVKKFTGS